MNTLEQQTAVPARLHTKSVLYKVLQRALSTKRPHGSLTNVKFTSWLMDNLPAVIRTGQKAWRDKIGNLHVDARNGASRTLFVAHVDTVHRTEGYNRIRKTATHWEACGDVLGADDGAGVAMLMHLLHAGVPAYYIFTQGEEKGGIGARHLADQHGDLLLQFDRAIAFDRRSMDSIISHQGWGRCCSDTFAHALADALNERDEFFMYSPDDSGIYTDTAEFVDFIPECTNISVGYDKEHTERESLNIAHYAALAQAAVGLDWENLPAERDPKDQDFLPLTGGWSKIPTTTTAKGMWTLDDDMDYVCDCLDAAVEGDMQSLVRAMSEAVIPADSAQAARLINTNKITPELCDKYLSLAYTSEYIDADDLLLDMFDEVCNF